MYKRCKKISESLDNGFTLRFGATVSANTLPLGVERDENKRKQETKAGDDDPISKPRAKNTRVFI
jgi:hypothetical protein